MKKGHFMDWFLAITLILITAFAIGSYVNEGAVYQLFNGDTTGLSESIGGSTGAVFIFILLMALSVVVAPIPALILYVAGGLIFGIGYGSLYSLIGNLLGAALAFQLSRNWAREYFEKRLSRKRRDLFDKFSLKYGTFAIFILRVNPLTSTDLFSYIAGLSRINFWRFLFATGAGLVPVIVAQTYIGKAISNNPLLSNMFLSFGVGYVLIFIAIFIYVQWNKNRKELEEENAKLSSNKKR